MQLKHIFKQLLVLTIHHQHQEHDISNKASQSCFASGLNFTQIPKIKSFAPCKMGLAKFNEPVTMQLIAVQGIYCKAEADMVGPIQTSAFNNKYIITAIDYMSKNIEDAAVLSTSSKTTADFSYRETVCRHG